MVLPFWLRIAGKKKKKLYERDYKIQRRQPCTKVEGSFT